MEVSAINILFLGLKIVSSIIYRGLLLA